MRLIFAIKSLNVIGGGAERVIADVANGLVHKGHEVFILTFDSLGNSFYPLDDKVVRINLAIGYPGVPTPRIKLMLSLLTMRRQIIKLTPDLVIGFMHSMYIPLGIALYRSGLPVIASEHTDFAHYKQRPLQQLMVKTFHRLFVGKTVPSDFIREGYDLIEKETVVVLPNPVNTKLFESIDGQKISTTQIILSIGRFMQEKNFLELIDAFALISSKHPDWILRIVGDGVLRKEIESKILSHGLNHRVELPGTTLDVAPEYAKAAFVVVPSRYESFGMVIVEAQAAGRAVIGFADCRGAKKMIEDDVNGVLVSGENNRSANLAKGLDALISDPNLCSRLGDAGPESAQRFSIDNVADRWESYFLKLHDNT